MPCSAALPSKPNWRRATSRPLSLTSTNDETSTMWRVRNAEPQCSTPECALDRSCRTPPLKANASVVPRRGARLQRRNTIAETTRLVAQPAYPDRRRSSHCLNQHARHFSNEWKMGDFRHAVTSQNMNEEELTRFRTQICPRKSYDDSCTLEERCPFSHCLSWHRRNPHVSGYRPSLCPNVIFSIGSDQKMRVKNHCKRGRQCMFSHTKEEQMYHPLVYKTQVCRDWPGCSKHFCPFAHGNIELRAADAINFSVVQGPEKPEAGTEKSGRWTDHQIKRKDSRRPSRAWDCESMISTAGTAEEQLSKGGCSNRSSVYDHTPAFTSAFKSFDSNDLAHVTHADAHAMHAETNNEFLNWNSLRSQSGTLSKSGTFFNDTSLDSNEGQLGMNSTGNQIPNPVLPTSEDRPNRSPSWHPKQAAVLTPSTSGTEETPVDLSVELPELNEQDWKDLLLDVLIAELTQQTQQTQQISGSQAMPSNQQTFTSCQAVMTNPVVMETGVDVVVNSVTDESLVALVQEMGGFVDNCAKDQFLHQLQFLNNPHAPLMPSIIEQQPLPDCIPWTLNEDPSTRNEFAASDLPGMDWSTSELQWHALQQTASTHVEEELYVPNAFVQAKHLPSMSALSTYTDCSGSTGTASSSPERYGDSQPAYATLWNQSNHPAFPVQTSITW